MSSADQLLEELVFQVLERRERGDDGALDEVCRAHPELATELRRRFDALRLSGMLSTVEKPPERLGEFKLLRRLGQGGMGVVYLAEQPSLGRRVALKIVRPEQLYFRGARERFQREVEAVARLAHPGIVPVYSVGEHDGLPYYAMELVEGVSLAELLARLAGRDPARLSGADLREAVAAMCAERGFAAAPAAAGERLFSGSWSDVCAWLARDVAQALEHAHQRGVLHRDIKPSNVLLTPGGRVMLVDFGLASTQGSARITGQGSQVGSLAYMAPEAVAGDAQRVDARTDVYALGVMLYELYTLHLPFDTRDAAELSRRIAAGQSEPPRRYHSSLALDAETVCATAMEVDPERRYPSAAHLARDLTNLLEHRPIEARPLGPWLALRRWSQRRPALATACLLGLAVAVAAPWAYGVQEARAKRRIERERDAAEVERERAEVAERTARGEREAAVAARAEAQRAEVEARDQRDAAEAARERALAAEALAQQQRDAARANLTAALESIELLLERVGHRDLRDVPRVDVLRRDLLERATALYARLGESAEGDPALELRAASALGKLARLRRETGDLQGALADFDKAEARLRRLADARPDDPRVLFELGNLLAFSAASRPARAPSEAIARMEPAVELLRRAVALAPAERRPRSELARGLLGLAHFMDAGDQDQAARALWSEARTLAEALRAEDPADVDALELWATAVGRTADVDLASGDVELAERDFELLLSESAAIAEPSAFLRQLRSLTLQMLARIHGQREDGARDPEVDRLQRESQSELAALVRDFPRNDMYLASLQSSYQDQGDRALFFEDLAGARAAFAEALRLSERALELAPGDARRVRSIGLSSGRLAKALQRAGETEAALRHARAAAEAHARAVEISGRSDSRQERADALRQLIELGIEAGDPGEIAAAAHALSAEAPAGTAGYADQMDAAQALLFGARAAAATGDAALADQLHAEILPHLERALEHDPGSASGLLGELQSWGLGDDPALAALRQRLGGR